MSWVSDMLKRVGVLPEISADDRIDASIENSLHDHRKAVEELVQESVNRKAANDKLRSTLSEVKSRGTPWADFELSIRREIRRDSHQ